MLHPMDRLILEKVARDFYERLREEVALENQPLNYYIIPTKGGSNAPSS